MKRKGLRTASLCLGLSLPAVLAVQSGSAGGPTRLESGGTLRVMVSQDFRSIEPALIQTSDGQQIMHATQLSLLSYRDSREPGSRRIVPFGAAKLPNVSRDQKTYVFRIRPGLHLSDGEPVTARNFAEGLERVLDRRMESRRAFLFRDVSRVLTTGSRLTIHLSRPVPDFLDRLAMPVVTAMPLGLPVVRGGVDAPLPSAGPYYVKEYVPLRLAQLARNPYWKPATRPSRRGNVDEIVYLGRTPTEAADAVENGDADIATFADSTALAAQRIRDIHQRYGLNRDRFWARQERWRFDLVFNVRGPPFRDVSLRRAVNLILDRNRLASAHGPLAGSPTDQLLLPGRPGFRDWKLYAPHSNIAAAKRLARRERGAAVSIFVKNEESGRNVGELVRANLKQLGLRPRVTALEPSAYSDNLLLRGDWDLAVWSWAPSRDDPMAFINYALEATTYRRAIRNSNLGLFQDPVWITRMRRAAATRRGRLNAFATLDRDLMRQAPPLVPYLAANALTLFSARVGCRSWTSDGYPSLTGLCLR
jgi:peptide/nickel transport system substrate-binding protein